MTRSRPLAMLTGMALLVPAAALSEDALPETVSQVSAHMGRMTADMERSTMAVDDSLQFEPYQQRDQMFGRDDVVYLMRHGPTDWSKLDEPNVAPTDCANQRIMSEEGRYRMRGLGALLASNDVVPSQIVVSQWCRNQQTLDEMMAGFEAVDPEIADRMPVETQGDLNLLLSLQGSRDVMSLKERIDTWDGHPDREGPLLLISHYTNIEELTQFRVFEGEILVIDPKRDNLVLGYLRLAYASPDVGHFADTLASPLIEDDVALEMVSRYYNALLDADTAGLQDVLADGWVFNTPTGAQTETHADTFITEFTKLSEGLTDIRFVPDDFHVADGVVTVVGMVTGRHTGQLLGMAPTGKDVSFSSIAVHTVADGRIVETWQIPDRVALLRQIGADVDY